MLVAVFYFELYVPGVTSLKEKRAILRSLKQRLRNEHNVSVSEVDFRDKHMRTALGISCIPASHRDADRIFDKISNKIRDTFPLQISVAHKEVS